VLNDPATEQQRHLREVIWRPFRDTGDFPFWQYVDLTMDVRWSEDAQVVWNSLPVVRRRQPGSLAAYGLTWQEYGLRPDKEIGLTVAGLHQIPEAQPLVRAFLVTMGTLVDAQRRLVPEPRRLVEGAVTSAAIHDALRSASLADPLMPTHSPVLRAVRHLVQHEPIMWGRVSLPNPEIEEWEVRLPAELRLLRGIEGAEDYLDRVTEFISPPEPVAAPISADPLDLSYAVGYLDAVWKSRFRKRLFADLDAAAVARLTQPCINEGQFDSLMSALASVTAQMTTPEKHSRPGRRRWKR
jgi:hypothetical protein